MDSVNRHTARERPDLLEWRKCQGQAGLYGVLAIVIGGTMFAGLSVFPPVPKKYIPLLSLGFGAGCGWFVSHRAVISCHRSLSMDATFNDKDSQSKEIPSIQRAQQETKFGDKGFLKE
ncbi:uncharacterized protein LOC141897412 isoform X2 [Acropora palmata]|uniref:uncharacterized protein LOC141897412 isoform X2 n=1 Tax=Acropora palmata TaxID=6131 RepID=UPI003DA19FAA